MIGKFLIERRSWIMLFILLQLLLVFIAYIDPNISMDSISYYVFLSSTIFVLFLTVRFVKESKFYQSLTTWINEFDESELTAPASPFEKIVYHNLSEQAEHLKQLESQNRTSLEQEKNELLSWIHEVKTPLTAMQLIIDRIEDNALKADLNYEWLRVHLLLDQQLHKKRMSFIENDLYIEKTELEPIIYQEIKALKSWCIHKKIGFDINLEVETVLTDGKWLAFIIRQILSNAVKYSENSDIEISSEQNNNQTILIIQDHGRGIDAKDMPRIFEKGFTSTATHQDNSATGMGLYLTKQVSESLQINIQVKSELGEGTAIKLIFPKRNDFVAITET
ncbi:sensor histidine kinase [Alkalibacillus almallahensis]|uniref:sensor histidine kinase n=1 Tax=Alkalibacillus almallahensis TaxID=1379154 RepID=UPI0014213D7F|nr:sensor histidine kinase [Alkalibacillus almallahensis]NIK11378.1 OmpR family two-component system bacitracin resistance sensor histidine kinase BceS [Alkalibacillus almallahensis]